METGRWNKPHPIPLEERKCRFCTSLEDEFHFLFECKLHDGIRKTYIPRYNWNRPNIPKLIELFNSNNKKLLTNLGIYIYKAFKFRSELSNTNWLQAKLGLVYLAVAKDTHMCTHTGQRQDAHACSQQGKDACRLHAYMYTSICVSIKYHIHLIIVIVLYLDCMLSYYVLMGQIWLIVLYF